MKKWIGATMMMGLAQPAMAADPAFDRAVAAVEARMAPIDKMDNVIPGRAIVMVKAGRPPVIDVKGSTRVEGGKPIAADTPMYIASMTKAFVGLMAVRLDELGIMPLDSTLGSYFPAMKVEGVDVGKLSMKQLLSHQLGFEAKALNVRTAYTDLVPIDQYATVVNASGKATKPGFEYDNLGYLLYAAALEKRTGKSWRAWIDDVVFDPLGMEHSSARTSDFAEVSRLHERYQDSWRVYEPKSDDVMHAAGGLVVAPGDMARWLAANAGQASAIPQPIFDEAHSSQVAIERSMGPMKCTGYAFGWQRCEMNGLRFLEHGGGYTGMRSEMIVLPDKGVAFAAMFNSDSMTGGLGGQLAMAFVAAYSGQMEGVPTPEQLHTKYVEQTTAYRNNRSKEERERLADPTWQGWAWKPNEVALAEYGGAYRHPALGELRVGVEGKALVGRLNGTLVTLRPAAKDLFGATLATTSGMEKLVANRDSVGKVVSLDYADDLFLRQGD